MSIRSSSGDRLIPSLAEEFEELFFSKQCKDIIDEIHHVQWKLCYGCMFNHPGQLAHICLADYENKVDCCFNQAFEKVSLDLLLEDVKKKDERKVLHVNEVMLSVLASTIHSKFEFHIRNYEHKKETLPCILDCMDS